MHVCNTSTKHRPSDGDVWRQTHLLHIYRTAEQCIQAHHETIHRKERLHISEKHDNHALYSRAM